MHNMEFPDDIYKRHRSISAEARRKHRLRDDPEKMERFREDFEGLSFKFNLFANLYQFPLLSNQQQAIEMYAIARHYMDLDNLFEEIQSKIKGTHEFLENYQSQQINQSAGLLTTVATIGLTLSLVFGFFGMNIIVGRIFGNPEEQNLERFLFECFVLLVISCGLWNCGRGLIRAANRLRWVMQRWAREKCPSRIEQIIDDIRS